MQAVALLFFAATGGPWALPAVDTSRPQATQTGLDDAAVLAQDRAQLRRATRQQPSPLVPQFSANPNRARSGVVQTGYNDDVPPRNADVRLTQYTEQDAWPGAGQARNAQHAAAQLSESRRTNAGAGPLGSATHTPPKRLTTLSTAGDPFTGLSTETGADTYNPQTNNTLDSSPASTYAPPRFGSTQHPSRGAAPPSATLNRRSQVANSNEFSQETAVTTQPIPRPQTSGVSRRTPPSPRSVYDSFSNTNSELNTSSGLRSAAEQRTVGSSSSFDRVAANQRQSGSVDSGSYGQSAATQGAHSAVDAANRASSKNEQLGRQGADVIDRTTKGGNPMLLLMFFASVGLNFYLGWIAWDTYNRYQDMVSDMRRTSGSSPRRDRGNTERRDRRLAESY